MYFLVNAKKKNNEETTKKPVEKIMAVILKTISRVLSPPYSLMKRFLKRYDRNLVREST